MRVSDFSKWGGVARLRLVGWRWPMLYSHQEEIENETKSTEHDKALYLSYFYHP